MSFRKIIAIAAAALSMVTATTATAATVVVNLTPANVIGSSGSYSPGFAAGNIFDQQTGPVADVFGVNYWINPDNGPANAFITIDLGAAYSLATFELFNTHNTGYGDRGTGAFTIVAGNSVSDLGAGNYTLSGTTYVIANGVLTAAPVSDPISGQMFAATNPGTFRYLQFLPTSVASANAACCGSNVYGLAELRIAAVPEPATWAMMLAGFGLVGFGLRRRAKPMVSVTYA